MIKIKKIYIISSLIIFVLFMSITYAMFSSQLNISGVSNITSTWNIKITDIKTIKTTGSASNKEEPSFTDTTANFAAELISPSDSIEYEVSISNAGSIDATLNKINLNNSNNPAIDIKVSGLEIGDSLLSGKSKTLKITVTYNDVTSQPQNTKSDLSASFEFTQATSQIINDNNLLNDRITASKITNAGISVTADDNGTFTIDGKSTARQFIRLTDTLQSASTMTALYIPNVQAIVKENHEVKFNIEKISGECTVPDTNLFKIVLCDTSSDVGVISPPHYDFFQDTLVSTSIVHKDVGMVALYISNDQISCNNFKFKLSLTDENEKNVIERATISSLALTLDDEGIYTLNGSYNSQAAAIFRLNQGLKVSTDRKDLYIPNNVIVKAGFSSELQVEVISGNTNLSNTDQLKLAFRDATAEANYIPDRYYDFYSKELLNDGPFPLDAGMLSLFVKGQFTPLVFDNFKFRIYLSTYLPVN